MSIDDRSLDPAVETAIERALEAANLRPGDATAAVIHVDAGDAAIDHDAPGDAE